VLVPGVASTLEIDRLRAAAEQSTTFRATLVRHGLAVYAQIQEAAGCNAAHTVESRLARCLLHTCDLSGSNNLLLAQESMAQIMGARRNSVSLVANTLQQAKFIHYSRGAYRDHRFRWPQQDLLRMLRNSESPVREADLSSLPA
jgi:hypothetical protein